MLLLCGLASPAAAQTSEELQGRYGPPLASTYARRPTLAAAYGAPLTETYVVRPDISLTVSYAADGETCLAELRPYSSAPEMFPPPEVVSAGEVGRIVEEIAPSEARGSSLNAITFTSSCSGATTEWGESVDISRAVRAERCGGGVYAATVAWKWRRCAEAAVAGERRLGGWLRPLSRR